MNKLALSTSSTLYAPALIYVVGSMFLVACGASVQATTNESVADTVVPSVDPIASPTALLRELKQAIESRDEPALRARMRTVHFRNEETNTERAVERILRNETQGSYGYTSCAMDSLIALGDSQFQTPQGSALDLVEAVVRADASLARLWEESPDSFRAIWNDSGYLLLVRENTAFQVLMWRDLQALTECEAEAPPSRFPPGVEQNLRAAFGALAEYTDANGLPPAIPFTPISIVEGVCEAPQWEPGGFAPIGFVPAGPVRFAYSLNVDGQNNWELLALGDPECDGQRVVVRMTGGIDREGLYRNVVLDVRRVE